MSGEAASRPNIVFILTDDQGCWAMGCAGNTEIKTPNLDRIAATGMRFENFFCASPVCSPARASIMTGRMPSQHGVHDWLRAGNSIVEKDRGGELIEYLKGQPGITDFLAANGYTCGISGKWHLGDAHHAQKSFSFWKVHAKGGGPYYKAPMIRGDEVYEETRYVTDAITDTALEFLGQQGSENLFYLSIHYTAPHSPWARDQHPKDTFDEYLANCPFDSTPRGRPHEWCRNNLFPKTEERRRATLSGYYTAVTEMDRNVGRVLDTLEEKGLRDNTLVIFTSDNGMNMGHHGIYGKGNGTFPQNMYDTSVKVPTLMSWPASLPQGQVCEALLSHCDILPTLLELNGIENPDADALPGRSFAPLLQGESFDGRENVVVHDEYGPVRMIRTREWKYVHRYLWGPHELYDLTNDPDEIYNLIDMPEHQERIVELRRALEEWFASYTDPAVDGRGEAVTGAGQLGLAGVGRKGIENYAAR